LRGFAIFCKKLQNVCPVAANPDQMDKRTKTDAIFGLSAPQNPQIHYKLQVPENAVYRYNQFVLLGQSAKVSTFLIYQTIKMAN